MDEKKMKKRIKKRARKKKIIKCPICYTTDFDVTDDGKQGFCTVGCGTWFSISKNGATRKVGTTKREVAY